MTTPRSTEYLALSDLKADPRNPKAHDLEVIDASVGRFGIIDNIARDDRTGFIISGHGRTKTLQAMQERGESAPDGVIVREDGEWLVPVITGWRSRTDAEAGAALIALNRTTELGGWVDEALLDILDDLAQDDGAGLDGVGFSAKEVEDLHALIDGAPDLDDLADQWDGSGLDDGNPDEVKGGSADDGGPTLSIHLHSEDTAHAWRTHASGFESNEEALRSLLGL